MSGTSTYTYTYIAPLGNVGVGVLQRSDNAFVPCDLGNEDYQRFLDWLAAGNPAPAGWTGPTNPPGGTAG